MKLPIFKDNYGNLNTNECGSQTLKLIGTIEVTELNLAEQPRPNFAPLPPGGVTLSAAQETELLRAKAEMETMHAEDISAELHATEQPRGYGDGTPFPLREIVRILADATDHLLHKHDCDQHGHEVWMAALHHAKKYLGEELPAQPAVTEQPQGPCTECGYDAWSVSVESGEKSCRVCDLAGRARDAEMMEKEFRQQLADNGLLEANVREQLAKAHADVENCRGILKRIDQYTKNAPTYDSADLRAQFKIIQEAVAAAKPGAGAGELARLREEVEKLNRDLSNCTCGLDNAGSRLLADCQHAVVSLTYRCGNQANELARLRQQVADLEANRPDFDALSVKYAQVIQQLAEASRPGPWKLPLRFQKIVLAHPSTFRFDCMDKTGGLVADFHREDYAAAFVARENAKGTASVSAAGGAA